MSHPAGSLLISLLLCLTTVPALAQSDNLVATLPSSYAHYGIAWSPDSTRFVRWQITPVEYPAEIIETATGTIVYELPIIEDAVWSPDGSYLLVELYDRFDIITPNGVLVQSIAFSSDWIHPSGGWVKAGTAIIITSWTQGTTTVYDLVTGEAVYSLPQGERADWSWDGSVIVTVGEADSQSVFVWDGDNGDLITTLQVSAFEAKLSPDGTRVLIDASDSWEVWSVFSATRLTRLDLPDDNDCGSMLMPQWSADSGMLLTTQIIEADTGEVVPQPDAFAPTGQYIEYTPDYRLALTWNSYPTAAVWDVATGAQLLVVPHHSVIDACSTSYWPPSLSPDGRYLVMWDSGRQRLDPYIDVVGVVESGSGDSTVTLYAEPDITSTIVAELADSTPVQITSSGENGWWQVTELTSRQIGWVRNDGHTGRLYATRNVDPYMQIWRVDRE